MINLERVTITGADDNTNVHDLVKLSKEFPFVEWGILVSKYRNPMRFPSPAWIDEFSALASIHKLNVATHVCGKWVRSLLMGDLDWAELPSCLEVSQRVQINTHSQRMESSIGFLLNLERKKEKTFIIQWDGVNNHLAKIAKNDRKKIEVLFDMSGGAGILPDSWPVAFSNDIPCGYAGGLGPDNVVEQLEKISAVCPSYFWIDMERRVRTDEEVLDLDKVREVLLKTKDIVEKSLEARRIGYASMH